MLNKLLKPLVPYLPENNRMERIWILAKFDFKSRYYYHNLGILWAFIRPIFEFIIYYIVFTIIFASSIPNYALYLFLGLVLWYFFVEGSSKGIHVLLSKKYLLENIPFNKLDLFTSSTFSAFFGFLFNFFAYVILSLILGIIPINAYFLYFPLLIANLFLLTMGTSLLLATIGIYVKDIQHVWDMVILAGLWLTPILYDKTLIEEKFAALLYLNPVSGIMINIREVILYNRPPDLTFLLFNFVYASLLFLLGYYLFTTYSHKAAEKL